MIFSGIVGKGAPSWSASILVNQLFDLSVVGPKQFALCLIRPGEGFSIISVNRGGSVAATLAKQLVWQRLFCYDARKMPY